MKSNLFIARTPLQLFNCIEAKDRFHKNEQNILFYQYQREIDKNQMQSLLIDTDWHKIISYPLKPLRRLLPQFFLFFINLKYKNKIESCYYGAYNSIISSLINKINPTKLILVDDGTKTLEIARLISEQNISKRSFIKKIRDKILSSNIDFIYNTSLFTIYDLEQFNIKNSVIKNDYREYKSYLKSLPFKDIVYFIGTNLNEKMLKDSSSFEKYIQNILEFYKDKEFIYILHRYENIDYIASLAQKYNFNYVKFDNILEVMISKEGFIPSEFATFGSSAIETLPLLYSKSHYRVFCLDIKDIVHKEILSFEKLYANLHSKDYDMLWYKGE